MSEVEILVCRESDVAKLEQSIPSPGLSSFHADRFVEQERGDSKYLVAWLDDEPVGHLNLRWDGFKGDPDAQAPDSSAIINALGVRPDKQNLGIGSALINYAEQLARERNYEHLALGVGVENTGAQRLYKRHGFDIYDDNPVVCQTNWIDDRGELKTDTEMVIVMSKSLG